jgi:hypothetical protein
MLRTLVLGSALLVPAVLLAGGCASQVPRADGSAGPVTPSPTVSSAPGTAPSPAGSVAPTSAPTRPAPSHPATSHRPSTPTVLGPTGLGPLKLGMSSKKATATGLLTPWRGTAAAGCSLYSNLVAAHSTYDGNVEYSGDTGVETIEAYPGISTPEGIHLGSTTAQMRRAYPDWTNAQDQDPHAEGVGGADVPGNTKAFYRIQTKNGKVVDLTLQVAKENCYE